MNIDRFEASRHRRKPTCGFMRGRIKGSTADVFNLANSFHSPPSLSKYILLRIIYDPVSILTGLVKPFDSMDYLAHAISLECDDSDRKTSQVQLWPTPQDWSPQDQLWFSGSQPELSIEIHSVQRSIMDTKAFTELLLGAVESLSLRWQQTTLKPIWRAWLSRARAVKLLCLRSANTAEVVIQTMAPLGRTTDVLFPSLETLVLAFPELATTPGPGETLLACVSARQAAGCPIHEVRLPMDAPWVDDLRTVVPVVMIVTAVDGRID
ncbi:hypothetical protein FA95DRAFT_1576999 [Auriscalpium vulgare]|uniref:Uncharacterized protein n=1 Tax=Auriscalpium vulgare TaxID=40419 RepID=A0ACB8R9B7_9AGAM|nr:hypothetical protein FA95DRAFT_1576999 [Auriscalpium vulgare]